MAFSAAAVAVELIVMGLDPSHLGRRDLEATQLCLEPLFPVGSVREVDVENALNGLQPHKRDDTKSQH